MMAWSSALAAIFWVVVGATVAVTVGSRDALIGIVLAVITFGAVNYVFAAMSSRTGLTVALLSRGLLGYFGAALATLVFAAGAIYFATFEGSILATSFQTQFGGSIKLWYLITVLYQLPLVLGGVRRWLDRLNAALLPLYLAGLVGAVIWAIARHGYSNSWLHLPAALHTGIEAPGWLFAYSVYMGVWLVTFYTVDFARFGRKDDERFNGAVTFGPVFYLLCVLLNALVGIFLTATLPANDGGLVVGVTKLMGIFGVIFIFASQTKINSANFYLASSNLESFFSRAFGLRLPRWVWVFVAGVAVYLFMLQNVFSFLTTALNYQAVVVVAWVAIALVEFAFRAALKQPAMEFRPGRVPLFNLPGLVAWCAASSACMVLLALKPAFYGTWGPPLTFVMAAGLYGLLRAIFGNRSDRNVRANDPCDEVEDAWETRIRCHHCDKSYIAVEMDRDPASNHTAICASCATGAAFILAAMHERRTAAVSPEPVPSLTPR